MLVDIRQTLYSIFKKQLVQDPPVRSSSLPFHHYQAICVIEDPIDLIMFCRRNSNQISFYWYDQAQQIERVGVAIADQVDYQHSNDIVTEINVVQDRLRFCKAGTQYFGGISFDMTASFTEENFSDFGHMLFVLPKLEIRCLHGKYEVVANLIVTNDDPILDLESFMTFFDGLCFDVEQSDQFIQEKIPKCLNQLQVPSLLDWEVIVKSVLKSIHLKAYEKCVIGRKSSYVFSDTLDWVSMLSHLKSNSENATTFLFRYQGNAFMGNSPEHLFKRTQGRLITKALAGTRRRGSTDKEDRFFEKQLIDSKKDLEEHSYVSKFINEVLPSLCVSFSHTKRAVVKLVSIQHICEQFEGELKEGVSDAQLLSQLHPTPAVCLYPKDALSLSKLSKKEGFQRGWFSAPIGFLGVHESEMLVGIRSCLHYQDQLIVFSGVGLVSDSNFIEEWEEVDFKTFAILESVGLKNSVKSVSQSSMYRIYN